MDALIGGFMRNGEHFIRLKAISHFIDVIALFKEPLSFKMKQQRYDARDRTGPDRRRHHPYV